MSKTKPSLAEILKLAAGQGACLADDACGLLLGAASGDYPVTVRLVPSGDAEPARTEHETRH